MKMLLRIESDPARMLGRMFLLLGVVFGMSIIAITPPFQAPDEPAHFYRAYAISELKLLGAEDAGVYGGYLPVSLHEVASKSLSDAPFHPEVKIDALGILTLFNIPLKKWRISFIEFPTASLNPPAGYLPQAIGISVGKLFNAPPLALLYLGRLSNLLFWIFILFQTLTRSSSGRWTFFLIALTPMALFQAASLSPDAFTTALCFALIAAFLNAPRHALVSKTNLIGIYLLSFLLMMSKPVYFPVLGMFFTLTRQSFDSLRRFILHAGSFFMMNLISIGCWSIVLSRSSFQGLSGEGLWNFYSFLANLPPLAGCMISTAWSSGITYFEQAIGVLGWLDTRFPSSFIGTYVFALIWFSWFRMHGENRLEPVQRTIMTSIAVINFFLIIGTILILAVQFGYRTLDQMAIVKGVQGRYFIPILPLMLIALNRIEASNRMSRLINVMLLLFTTGSLLLTVYVLAARYY